MLSPLKTERRDRRTRARTDEPARCWRVFYTRSRAEKRCAERLEDDGVEVLLPLRRVTRRWSDREKVVEEPLFKGYVFARVDEAERLRALQTDGVVRCLHVGGRPAEMRPEEVERLRALQRAPGLVDAVVRDAFPEGAEVYVANGPLAGLRGRVLGHPKARQLLVEVPTLRHAVRVHLPVEWATRPASASPVSAEAA